MIEISVHKSFYILRFYFPKLFSDVIKVQKKNNSTQKRCDNLFISLTMMSQSK